MEKYETIYFEKPGVENTDEALKISREYAVKKGIRKILIASTTGYTAKKALNAFKGLDVELIVVTHATGLKEPNKQEFPEELRAELEGKGVKFLTATHALGGVGRSFESSPENIIANTLRMFCQGVKVGVEMALMAADAGLVNTNEDVLAISGTGRGADTVIVVKPSNSRKVFNLRVKKILAKPL